MEGGLILTSSTFAPALPFLLFGIAVVVVVVVIVVAAVLNCCARATRSFPNPQYLSSRHGESPARYGQTDILVQIRRNLEFVECAAKFASSGLKQLH
jgi:hypothetical protein